MRKQVRFGTYRDVGNTDFRYYAHLFSLTGNSKEFLLTYNLMKKTRRDIQCAKHDYNNNNNKLFVFPPNFFPTEGWGVKILFSENFLIFFFF